MDWDGWNFTYLALIGVRYVKLGSVDVVTYDGDVVDGRPVMQQQRGAVDVVALGGHVQRTEPVLGLGRQLSVMVDQHLHDGAVAAATGAVQRCQTVLHQP